MITKGKYQKSYTKTCCICGGAFFPSHRKNKSCSRKCGSAARSGIKRTSFLFVPCSNCKQPVRVKPSKFSNKTDRFCNNSCHAEWRESHSLGASNPNFKNAGHKICELCRGPFQSYDRKRRFCSISCGENYSKGHPVYAAAIGNIYENKCCEHLEQLGFLTLKTKASRGPFDVIAWSGGELLFIQVKKTTTRIPSSSGWESLSKMKCPKDARKQVWINTPNETWKVIDL